jgi:hypothetical protein
METQEWKHHAPILPGLQQGQKWVRGNRIIVDLSVKVVHKNEENIQFGYRIQM